MTSEDGSNQHPKYVTIMIVLILITVDFLFLYFFNLLLCQLYNRLLYALSIINIVILTSRVFISINLFLINIS